MADYPWIVPLRTAGQNDRPTPRTSSAGSETIRALPAVERAYEKARAVNPTWAASAPRRARVLFGRPRPSVERAAAQRDNNSDAKF